MYINHLGEKESNGKKKGNSDFLFFNGLLGK